MYHLVSNQKKTIVYHRCIKTHDVSVQQCIAMCLYDVNLKLGHCLKSDMLCKNMSENNTMTVHHCFVAYLLLFLYYFQPSRILSILTLIQLLSGALIVIHVFDWQDLKSEVSLNYHSKHFRKCTILYQIRKKPLCIIGA